MSKRCNKCNGTGQLQMDDGDHTHDMECDWCDGTGTMTNKLVIKLCCYGADRMIQKGLPFDYEICPHCGAEIEIIEPQ